MGTPLSDELQTTQRAFEPLIDIVTAAGLLKIHPKTLQRMARGGEIPAVRIGRYWRFRASHLDSWIRTQVDSNRQPCRSEPTSKEGRCRHGINTVN